MQSPPYHQGDRVSYFLYKKPYQNGYFDKSKYNE